MLFLLWYPLRNSVSKTQATLSVEALRLYLGDNFLLTVHNEPIPAIDNFKDALRSRPGSKRCEGAGFLLSGLLDRMIDDYLVAGEAIEDELEAMEKESLEMKPQATLLDRMRRLRKPLIEFHHLLGRHSILLSQLEDAPGSHLPEVEQSSLHHSQYHLKLAVDLAGRNRDTMTVIQGNFNSSLANRTNAIMKTLTLFASLMLPLSFVVGFYGMNLPLWPDPQDPRSLIWITSGMAGIIVLLLIFFRWRRWL